DAADAFAAAFRIPNFLQNLFGEGALSASFIPVYAKLLAEDDPEEADRMAGAVGSMLALTVAVLVLAGVLLAPVLVDLLTPGFEGAKRDLTVHLVRILYPGAGLLVLSAWCLGILNTHGRFFLSYAAPVIWNLAIIAALIIGGRSGSMFRVAEFAAWGSVIGSALQFGIQLPAVFVVARRLRPALSAGSAHVRTVARNFGPAGLSRGVVQVSSYVDAVIASLLPTGALAALSYSQMLYTLPVSLFGIAVSAAELPAMSGATGDDATVAEHLRRRLDGGLKRIAFHVIPSAVAFAALGHVLAAAIFQSGQFTADDSYYVWGILAGSSVGLLAATMARLYSSAFYALRDTRTPFRFAVVRVAVGTVLGACGALLLPELLGLEPRWGAAGLTLAASISGWAELGLLRRAISRRIGPIRLDAGYAGRCWFAAVAAAAIGVGMWVMLRRQHPAGAALVVVFAYGTGYFAIAAALGIDRARRTLRLS
ncbi:MAG TPA: murein biosynthesis integral membrane protein MurJ, partial [Gemmatimonadales bacterium]|nr:murein biosynthesis integral membrane protein MurJ [Gemmatimonadales bacterium]